MWPISKDSSIGSGKRLMDLFPLCEIFTDYAARIGCPSESRQGSKAREPSRAGGSRKTLVSYSFREPEWPTSCECKYDEIGDEMDCDDCPFHFVRDNFANETIDQDAPVVKKCICTTSQTRSARSRS